jgi:hypothetical protein
MTLVSFGTESDSSQKAHLEALLGLGLRVGVTGWVCQLPAGRVGAELSNSPLAAARSARRPAAAPDTGFELL